MFYKINIGWGRHTFFSSAGEGSRQQFTWKMNGVLWCWNPFPWVTLFQNVIVQENLPSPRPRKIVIIEHSPPPWLPPDYMAGTAEFHWCSFYKGIEKIYAKRSSINLLHKYKTELSLTLSVRYDSTQNIATFVSSETHIYPKYLCKDDASGRGTLFILWLTDSQQRTIWKVSPWATENPWKTSEGKWPDGAGL